jgi:hypothetical protein
MATLTPRNVDEAESDRRGIKDGWYAINTSGKVCSSRFSNREDSQAHINQEGAHVDALQQRDARNT